MRKSVYHLRWFWNAVIIAGHLTLLSYILFPLAYLLRNYIKETMPIHSKTFPKSFPSLHIIWLLGIIWFISSIYYSTFGFIFILNTLVLVLLTYFFLWVFLDYELYSKEESWYGEQRWLRGKGYDISSMNHWQKFLVAYRWNVLRNPAWNMYEVYRPEDGEKVLISSRGYLEENNSYLDIDHYDFATLRYVDIHGYYMDNQGDYLSIRYSILGWSSVYYTIKGKIYYQYSFADALESKITTFLCRLLLSFTVLRNRKKLKDLWNMPIWFEFHYGNNERRYTLRMKVKGGIKIFEEL